MAVRKPARRKPSTARVAAPSDSQRVETVENPGAGVAVKIALTPDAAERLGLSVLAAVAEARLANRLAEIERENKQK